MSSRTYIAIDLKSFYASVECADRQLDPLTTNLVVADQSRTDKTICLAVSPALKACGIPGRPRLFEVVQKVRQVNAQQQRVAPQRRFTGKSANAPELAANPALELDYIIAVPRMARYIEVSSQIYGIYLKYVSPDDIHVYSIDEVFIDATSYLKLYKLSARDFTMELIREVLASTGITATAGIGTNLYLSKIAMDIVAKHIPADKDGVRIAELGEQSYREKLWSHRPLTDFWRVGHGYAARLESMGMHTMGDVARMSVKCEDVLYRAFGVNAELLIDHAWGSFRRRVNRDILPHLLAFAVFMLFSFSYFRYLISVESETFPLAFGMMPVFGGWTGPFRWMRYIFSLYCFHLPNNIGMCFLLGMIACLAPRLLPKNGMTVFLRIFVPVSLLSITFVHSSFYSNDFGWRTFTAAVYVLSLFSAFLLVKFIDWFRAGRRGRRIFGYAMIFLLVVFECSLYPDMTSIGLRKTYPELRGQFARSVKGWDVVHRHTEKHDLVQCSPRSFYELGMLYEMKELSTNIFFSLYSRRATAVADMIFAKCYSEYYPQEKLQQRYDRVCRIFDGDPAEPDIGYMAEDLKVKAVLVTPYDGMWEKPGAIRKYYPRLIRTPDYKVYLRE